MDKYLILVNKTHRFKPDFNYNIKECPSLFDYKIYCEEITNNQFLKLREFIKKKGYIIEIESGYRDEAHQKRVWDETLAAKGLEHTLKYVAKPGYSEHNTGLAIDFCLKENGKLLVDFQMKDKEVLDIVAANAHLFGFIIRYPKGKENITGYNYEPWHIRYVGEDVATFIYSNNLTLEEYLERK